MPSKGTVFGGGEVRGKSVKSEIDETLLLLKGKTLSPMGHVVARRGTLQGGEDGSII
jgi:hypothetical protein